METVGEKDKALTLKLFSGVSHLLIVGEGEVELLKSLDRGATFYSATDSSGEKIVFTGTNPEDVLYNAEIEVDCQKVRYAIKCTSGQVKCVVENDKK